MSAQRCKREVVELHAFFEDWFRGELTADDAAFARLERVLDEDFAMVGPGGILTQRTELISRLRAAHASWVSTPDARIWIENVASRPIGVGLWLVVYEEWLEQGGKTRGRQSTAILRERSSRPNGLVWCHLHETWFQSDDA